MALEGINPRAADIGENILRQLIKRLGDAWDELEGEEVELFQICSADAGVLAVAAMVAPQTPAAQNELLREKAHIHAQLLNLTSAAAQHAAREFWEVVKTVVNGAVAVVFAAL